MDKIPGKAVAKIGLEYFCPLRIRCKSILEPENGF
jgi:hypothetical protein